MDGWDYQTYMSQPDWFIDLIGIKMNLEAEHAKREANRAKRKSKVN